MISCHGNELNNKKRKRKERKKIECADTNHIVMKLKEQRGRKYSLADTGETSVC